MKRGEESRMNVENSARFCWCGIQHVDSAEIQRGRLNSIKMSQKVRRECVSNFFATSNDKMQNLRPPGVSADEYRYRRMEDLVAVGEWN
jgi:hypothetical protein